ncbi:MAG: TRAP transporter large permease subunit, partial [bacterium]
ACAIAGIVIASTTMTGIAQTITHNIVKLSEGIIVYALFFIMLATLLMSMALPISACYITVVVLAAPALIKMGIEPIVAHFFVLWFASLSGMTPPVALTSYSAASIARADPNRTAMSALRIVAPAFALPYIFVLYPELLWQGTISIMIIPRTTLFIVGSCICLTGYAFTHLYWVPRLVLLCGSVLLFIPKPYLPAIGGGLIVLTIAWNWLKGRRAKGGRNV